MSLWEALGIIALLFLVSAAGYCVGRADGEKSFRRMVDPCIHCPIHCPKGGE